MLSVCTCASLLASLLASASARAAPVLYDFSVPPATTLFNGSFTYTPAGGPTTTFDGLQHDDGGAFPDHTNGSVGAVFGAGPGPALITFESPVEFIELFVNNFNGDFDDRPTDFKLFSITASLGGTTVFSYDRAAESTAGNGLSSDVGFLLVAPATPVTIDSITLSNFDSDALDDLKVNVVPEPAGALAWVAGAIAVARAGGRRRGRGEGSRSRRSRRGGHAPERDPPRADCGGQFTTDTQRNGPACAGPEKIFPPALDGAAAMGTLT